MPFIWSLAWFSFWLFRDSIVLAQPLFQGSNSNYIGIAVSVVALLIKGYISGKSKEKQVATAEEVRLESEIQPASYKMSNEKVPKESTLTKEFAEQTQYTQSEKLELPIERYPTIESSQIETSNKTSPEPIEIAKNDDGIKNEVDLSIQPAKYTEIPSECLICPNLTNCDQRKKITANSELCCPLTNPNLKKLSENP